ncbi:hypothetical protein FHG87_019015 [Trinorchestia longiramus]|nr:hypothetical protein FHG87_019015 [Trinorchestia longiramus]
MRMRVERSRHILNEIAQDMFPNLVFTDEKKFDIQQVLNHENDSSYSVEDRIVTRLQNAQSVMVWVAVAATGRSPLVFVPCWVKMNSERYIFLILESKLLPRAIEHFQSSPWSLQQDSTPSHGCNVTQTWIQRNIPSFIRKDVWPTRSPDLNPLDFSIWSILETRVLAISYVSLESLKAKLRREWEIIPQEQIRVACDAFLNRLKAAVCNKGGYIKEMQHCIVCILFTFEFHLIESKSRI